MCIIILTHTCSYTCTTYYNIFTEHKHILFTDCNTETYSQTCTLILV